MAIVRHVVIRHSSQAMTVEEIEWMREWGWFLVDCRNDPYTGSSIHHIFEKEVITYISP